MSNTGAELAVQGYIELGQWLLDKWGAHSLKIATQIDNGTLTPDAMIADINACAFLSLQSAGLFVNEAFDAVAVLSGQQDQPRQVTSVASFSTINSASERTLRSSDLTSAFQDDVVPASAVAFVPPTLGPGISQFSLVVAVTGHHSEAYFGSVDVLDSNGVVIDNVPVWIAV
jgi:hypothetical protein